MALATVAPVRAEAAPMAAPPALPCPPVITCDPAAAVARDAAATTARATFDAMVGWVADGAKALLDRVATMISDTTRVDITAPWFKDRVNKMQSLALLLVVPLLLAALISAVIHQDAGRLVRAVCVHLPLAVLGMFAAMQLTNLALAVTDALCNYTAAALGKQTPDAVNNVSQAMSSLSTPLNPGTGGFLAFVAAALVVVGALLIWLELLLRSTTIYIAVFFLPLVLSGLVWPATARWSKRLVEILASLIFSKFVIVAVISLGVAALSANDAKDGLGTGLTGAAMLLLAGFAPFALLRLVPIVEAGVIGHLEGMSHRPIAAGMTSAQMVQRMVLAAGGGGAGAAAMAERAASPASTLEARPARGLPGFLDPPGPSPHRPDRPDRPSSDGSGPSDEGTAGPSRPSGSPDGGHQLLATAGVDEEGGGGGHR